MKDLFLAGAYGDQLDALELPLQPETRYVFVTVTEDGLFTVPDLDFCPFGSACQACAARLRRSVARGWCG